MVISKSLMTLALLAAVVGCTSPKPEPPRVTPPEIGRYQVSATGVYACPFMKVDTVTGRAWCRAVDKDLGTYWYPLVADERTLKDEATQK